MSQEKSIKMQQLVSFSLANEEFGVDIIKVQEIMRVQEITKVPQMPDFVEGVINLRGNVIPIIDLRKKFGLEVKERDNQTRIIVVNVHDKIVGFSCYVESRDEDLKDTGEIMAIYILKEYQGLGIGKKLMKKCYEELCDCSTLILWVLGSNTG